MVEKQKYSNQYKWEVLIVVMIGTLMASLDTSIVNVSIPAIMADFGCSVDDVEWVITGYMLAFATLMPLTAWLRDRIGHKLLYSISLIVFTAGSLLCGLAWNIPSLVFARIIQAMGGGALTPTGMAMISEVFEPHERARAMGWWGVGVIIGPAFGPTLGGYLTKTFGWPSIFLVNLPIGILGLWAATQFLHNDKPTNKDHRPFDYWGFSFLTVFLVTFLYGVSMGEHDGWTSPIIIWCGIFAVVGFIAFILVESLTEHRVIDLKLFKYPVFSISMILTATRSMALFGGIFLLPLFLQQLKGLDEIQSGLILLPGSLVVGFFMPMVGRLSEKVGPRYLAIVGIISLTVFMYMYRHINTDMNNWDIIFPTIIRGFGLSFLIAPIIATTLNSVPKFKAGMASSMMNIFQQIGGSLGIAFFATVLSNRIHHHMDSIGSAINYHSPLFKETVKNFTQRAHDLGYGHVNSALVAKASVIKIEIQKASEHAFQDVFLVGTLIIVATLIPAVFLPGSPTKKEKADLLTME